MLIFTVLRLWAIFCVVRASASGAVDLGLIPSRVKPMTFKLVFTASPLDAQHYRDSVEKKPTSLLVPLGNALATA